MTDTDEMLTEIAEALRLPFPDIATKGEIIAAIKAAEAKLEWLVDGLKTCVRYQTTVEEGGKQVAVPCLLLDHVQDRINQATLQEQDDEYDQAL